MASRRPTSNSPQRAGPSTGLIGENNIVPGLVESVTPITDASVPIAGPSSNKRPIALNGITSTVEEKNVDFLCPICFDLIVEAHITRCGHTFCHNCIIKSIEALKRCPKCNSSLLSAEHIFPNYLLGELISKYRLKIQTKEQILGGGIGHSGASSGGGGDGLKDFLTTESQKLTLGDVNVMLEILAHRKQSLEAESCTAQNRLLYDFLKHLLKLKEDQEAQIAKEIDLVRKDIDEVKGILKDIEHNEDISMKHEIVQLLDKMESNKLQKTVTNSIDEGFNSLRNEPTSSSFISRKRRMHEHFDDFVKSYFAVRTQDLYASNNVTTVNRIEQIIGAGTTTTTPTPTIAPAPAPAATTTGTTTPISVPSTSPAAAVATVLPQFDPQTMDHITRPVTHRKGLDIFRDNLVHFSKYNTLRSLATMYYSNDMLNVSTIVSSIVFDKDNEYFAIGGVTKRIKVFDFLAVIRDTVDLHYPSIEMVSNSKISCITWNRYQKNVLASSDYEGAVNTWDVQTGQRTQCFHEHEKRCWSVDFNHVDTRLIASGSDDARVKLWTMNLEHSIATLEAKANVCCVKFNPKSSCHLAFGSADHDVHYYDLRKLNKPICVFKGHKKAVSYVKFLNTEEIISASTDSQLKLWNVNTPPFSNRSFVGHINEKNFVGLATDDDYVACGSEDNALYIYYKGLSKPLFSYKIDSNKISDTDRMSEVSDFVSAVCWRKGCNVVLAANSRGLIKILELV